AEGEALGAADLGPDVLVAAHQIEKQPELGAVDRLPDNGPAHVIDDDHRRQRGEEVVEQRQVAPLEVDDDVPAERLDAGGDLGQLGAAREGDQTPDAGAAHAAHAGVVKILQLAVADAQVHGGDAARLAGAGAARV